VFWCHSCSCHPTAARFLVTGWWVVVPVQLLDGSERVFKRCRPRHDRALADGHWPHQPRQGAVITRQASGASPQPAVGGWIAEWTATVRRSCGSAASVSPRRICGSHFGAGVKNIEPSAFRILQHRILPKGAPVQFSLKPLCTVSELRNTSDER